MKRNVYLAMKTLEEAKEIFFSRFGPDLRTGTEEIQVEESLGRVTSEPVFARISAPSYHSAAMDGIVVRAEDTYGSTERNPKILQIGKSMEHDYRIKETFRKIFWITILVILVLTAPAGYLMARKAWMSRDPPTPMIAAGPPGRIRLARSVTSHSRNRKRSSRL